MMYVMVWEVQDDGTMVEKSWSYADATKQILIEQDVLFNMPFYYRNPWGFAGKMQDHPNPLVVPMIAVDVLVVSHLPEAQGGGTEVGTKIIQGYPGLFPVDISDIVNPDATSIELRTSWYPIGFSQVSESLIGVYHEQINLWFTNLGDGWWQRDWPAGSGELPVD